MRGLKMAGAYSYPPCRLGFCGQKIKESGRVLGSFLKGEKISLVKIRKVLKSFEATYPYYEMIAKANGIKDALDERVIESYWLGNELLKKVNISDIKKLILRGFTGKGLLSKEEAERRVSLIPQGATPHHSFHVLVLGSITGRVKLAGKLLDHCLPQWGKVLEINKKGIKVLYKPLKVKGKKLFFSEPIKKSVSCDEENLRSENVKKGDVISFHWNHFCQVISKEQQKNLSKYTLQNITALNKN